MGKPSIFLACMFLGLGIGMLFDQAGAGIIIGMGIGFLVEGLIGGREFHPIIMIRHKRSITGSIISIIIGIGFILGGLALAGLIVLPENIWRMFGAAVIIAIGLGFLLLGIPRH